MNIKFMSWLSCKIDDLVGTCDGERALRVTTCPVEKVISVIESCDGTLMYGITNEGNVAWELPNPSATDADQPPEEVEFTQQTNITYDHNNNGGTSDEGMLDNTSCVAKTAGILFGPGLEYPASDWNGSPSTYEWVVSGINSLTKADAIASDDYIEFTFAMIADGAITNWYQGLEPQPNSTGAGGYNFALMVSDDNFVTSTELISDDYLRQPQTEGDNGNNTRVNHNVTLNHPTEAGKDYTLRYYMWNTTASGLNGSALYPNTQNKLVEGTAAFDDVTIRVEC